ncbi:MAG: 2Fe-2S iron-sulfur cluster-binding protein, partial [Bradyrhizobium sp.]|uniref:2Fe-2S iron-sulfur cluster-binding protein n=1 Tax=Bradyrhizobium sp. TaxID=376 RepID=UPI0039195762
MTTITFIHPDNRSETVEAEDGATLMLAALTHGVDGIVAECGGNAVCATCHVYVDETFQAETGRPSAMEESMLD